MEIEEAVNSCDLQGRVTLAGWVSEPRMREILAATDILLMPSTSEGNPVAAIEALKHGVAILGSNIGGLTDIIEDGSNGFAIPLEDPSAFRRRLGQLAADPSLVERMKNRSLELSQKFDINQIGEDFERLLEPSFMTR